MSDLELITTAAGGADVLYPLTGSKKREWNFVQLVAKPESRHKTKLFSSDASQAFCTLCHQYITFSAGNGNSVFRHMQRQHPEEMGIDELDAVVPANKKQKKGHNMNSEKSATKSKRNTSAVIKKEADLREIECKQNIYKLKHDRLMNEWKALKEEMRALRQEMKNEPENSVILDDLMEERETLKKRQLRIEADLEAVDKE